MKSQDETGPLYQGVSISVSQFDFELTLVVCCCFFLVVVYVEINLKKRHKVTKICSGAYTEQL